MKFYTTCTGPVCFLNSLLNMHGVPNLYVSTKPENAGAFWQFHLPVFAMNPT